MPRGWSSILKISYLTTSVLVKHTGQRQLGLHSSSGPAWVTENVADLGEEGEGTEQKALSLSSRSKNSFIPVCKLAAFCPHSRPFPWHKAFWGVLPLLCASLNHCVCCFVLWLSACVCVPLLHPLFLLCKFSADSNCLSACLLFDLGPHTARSECCRYSGEVGVRMLVDSVWSRRGLWLP